MTPKSIALEMVLAAPADCKVRADGGYSNEVIEDACRALVGSDEYVDLPSTWTNDILFRALEIAGTGDLRNIRNRLVELGGYVLAWAWDIDTRLGDAA